MSNDRDELDKHKSTGGADRAAKDQQHTNPRAREESREQGHTTGGNGRDKPKDDPSRAPESGTP